MSRYKPGLCAGASLVDCIDAFDSFTRERVLGLLSKEKGSICVTLLPLAMELFLALVEGWPNFGAGFALNSLSNCSGSGFGWNSPRAAVCNRGAPTRARRLVFSLSCGRFSSRAPRRRALEFVANFGLKLNCYFVLGTMYLLARVTRCRTLLFSTLTGSLLNRSGVSFVIRFILS